MIRDAIEDRLANHFRDEWHGAGGARVDLEDVDVAILDGELHVHEADDVERQSELAALAFQFGNRFI
jgi:hypothetical protein